MKKAMGKGEVAEKSAQFFHEKWPAKK